MTLGHTHEQTFPKAWVNIDTPSRLDLTLQASLGFGQPAHQERRHLHRVSSLCDLRWKVQLLPAESSSLALETTQYQGNHKYAVLSPIRKRHLVRAVLMGTKSVPNILNFSTRFSCRSRFRNALYGEKSC